MQNLTHNGTEDLPTTPAQLIRKLSESGIVITLHKHEPIFTVAEGEHLKASIPGTHCRNLFLRDKKGAMFLVVLAYETTVDLKKLEQILGCGRLSFGSPERLWQYLGIRPGSVCPFCIINDTEHQVSLILDAEMMKAGIVNYHPLDNAQTIGLTPDGLLAFFKSIGRGWRIMDLPA